MATAIFDIAAERLEESTDMDRLAARGTLRIALKHAGLEVQKLTISQLKAVFEKLMPKELEARGVIDAAATCNTVIANIASAASEAGSTSANSTDEIFKRLGGS
jgi:hypothetical protein